MSDAEKQLDHERQEREMEAAREYAAKWAAKKQLSRQQHEENRTAQEQME